MTPLEARQMEANRELYAEYGTETRFGYLESLAEEYGVPLADVLAVAEILGPDEDFDALVTFLRDRTAD